MPRKGAEEDLALITLMIVYCFGFHFQSADKLIDNHKLIVLTYFIINTYISHFMGEYLK